MLFMETDRDPLMTDKLYDVFISHASEDKKEVVFPLVDQLKNLGVKHDNDDVLNTFTVMRAALMKMIETGKVPTREDLEKRLFGE